MHTSRRRTPGTSRVVVVAMLALLLTGCPDSPLDQPETAYTPDLVGPIEDVGGDPNQSDTVLVVRGQEVIITEQLPRALYGDLHSVGRLFLQGDDAGGWYMTVSHTETGPNAGCYGFGSEAAFDAGDFVVFALNRTEGVALSKADDFEMPREGLDSGDRYPPFSNNWCLNDEGEVVSVD